MARSTTTGIFLPMSGAALAGALALTVAFAPAASAATVVIDHLVGPAQAAAGNGWAEHPDQEGGTEEFVKGPATPPAGTGSLQLSVPTGETRALIFTVPNGLGTAVAWGDLAGSGYSTYTENTANPGASVAALKFVGYQDYNTDNPVLSDGFTTLNFEPSNNGTVTANEWQPWTIDEESLVWQSNTGDDNFCVQASPCTLAEFAAHYPQGAWGQVQIGLGVLGSQGGATSFVDAVTIAQGATTFGYNFEAVAGPTPTPTSTSTSTPTERLRLRRRRLHVPAVRAWPW